MPSIVPFTLSIPDSVLDDLKNRLANTRWPEQETVPDWSQGIKLHFVQTVCDHWLHRYDWRRCERMLNEFGQFKTVIDDIDIHFLHVRSPHPHALPLLITHGWPGSVIEFHKVIGRLTDPTAHGGQASDAFHVIAPSIPGYGFSGKPAVAGWTVGRIAETWIELMRRLGYQRWFAQGGDWGSVITTRIGALAPPGCAAIHVNIVITPPTEDDLADLSAVEQDAIARFAAYDQHESGYSRLQATRPQTIGYALADSPVGQAAWIIEKLQGWSDCSGDPLTVFSMDDMLDNVMLYWLPGTAASSARLYWESFHDLAGDVVDIPAGASIFPKEVFISSRRWAERRYRHLIHWNELDRGGHFAAFEQPDLFVREISDCFRQLR